MAAVFVRDDVLMALMLPFGPRAEWASLLAFLKLGRGAGLTVERSDLTFLDAKGDLIEQRDNAWGLHEGAQLTGPYSKEFRDDSRRPPTATLARWRLNAFTAIVELYVPKSEWRIPRVMYLPLQTPLAEDAHIIVAVFNGGNSPIDIVKAIRDAACWADGVPYASHAGRHWDGGYLLQPDHVTTRRFRLSNFPGIPREGAHEMQFQILGMITSPQTVLWRGEFD